MIWTLSKLVLDFLQSYLNRGNVLLLKFFKINTAQNQDAIMKKESRPLINYITSNTFCNDILKEEKVGSFLAQIKLFSSYKKKYDEIQQNLKELKDLSKNCLPSSAFQVPVADLKVCKIDDYINTQIGSIKESHFLEENELIKDRLKIDPILSRKRKRSADDANLNSTTERRVESYKRSRFHEKVRRMTRDLREEFINKKLNDSNFVLKKISELVIKQSTEVISPAVDVNEAIFECV